MLLLYIFKKKQKIEIKCNAINIVCIRVFAKKIYLKCFKMATKNHLRVLLLKYVYYSGTTAYKPGFLRHLCKEEQIDLKGNSIVAFGYLQRKTTYFRKICSKRILTVTQCCRTQLSTIRA